MLFFRFCASGHWEMAVEGNLVLLKYISSLFTFQKLEFMATIDLVTPDTLKGMLLYDIFKIDG